MLLGPDSCALRKLCSFFERVEEISQPDYVPSIEDVLKVRVRTSGIVAEEYIIDNVKFA